MDQPQFKTPIAQAQELGLRIYWLGESFKVDSRSSRITAGADLRSLSGVDSGLSLTYGLGGPLLDVETYANGGEEAQVRRERIADLDSAPGMSVEADRVMVGPWPAELFTVSAGARPVNQLALFIDLGDAVVRVRSLSEGRGVPGDDPNPLIQADVLIAVVEQNLRPYPE